MKDTVTAFEQDEEYCKPAGFLPRLPNGQPN